MDFSTESKVVERLSQYFPLKSDFDRALAEFRSNRRVNLERGDGISWSAAIRGMSAMRGGVISPATREQDINYAQKTLTTSSTPGSYLVPTVQAQEVIEFLSTNGILRAAGARIWNFGPGVKKVSVPARTGLPTLEWLGENTSQSASDPNLGQINFNLKTARCLTVLPNELLAMSIPSIDNLITELIGTSFAEGEDDAFFSTTSKSNGPTALYAASGYTSLLVGGSANGGNIAFSDIVAVLKAAATAKAKGPFVWFGSPRSFWTRIVSLVDSQSRPLFFPGQGGLSDAAQARLFGAPFFVTPFIAENETNGSGTNQSHLIYANPKYLHIAQAQDLEVAVSVERYFEANQTAIRGVRYEDAQIAPAAGVVVLKGVN